MEEKDFYRQWRENREMINDGKRCIFEKARFVVTHSDGKVEKVETIIEAVEKMR